jgi:DNA-binding IclR family transcriptional regulator
MLEEIAASASPPSAPEIARGAGVNRATAWRLLRTLEAFDLVRRDPQSGRYGVSYGVVRLAAATDAETLARRARPVLERLATATDASAFLEVPTHAGPVIVDEVRPSTPVLVDLAGMDVPLHCGSVGKLYLASLPEDELEGYLASGLERATGHTMTDPAVLRAEVDACRRAGIAVNYMEHREEWCGITAAVRDRAGRDLAYLNLTLPTFRWSRDALLGLADPLRAAAAEIAALIGALPGDGPATHGGQPAVDERRGRARRRVAHRVGPARRAPADAGRRVTPAR